MLQKISTIWSNRPMLLGVVIAGSLGAIGLSAMHLLAKSGSEPLRASSSDLSQPALAPQELDNLAYMERGNRASAAGNLVAPMGANALEFFISARDQQEPGAAQAVLELLPTALMQFDTELDRQSHEQAQQLLALIARADPKSPVLGSLQSKLNASVQAKQIAESAAISPDLAQAQVPEPAPVASKPEPALIASVAAPVSPAANRPIQSSAPRSVPRSNQEAPVRGPSTVSSRTELPSTPIVAQGVPTPSEKALTPKLIAAAPPVYPANAKRSKMEGWVDLKLTLNANGAVAEAEVIESEPSGIFDMAAKRAAKRYRFEASDRSSVVRQRVQFKIRS